MSARALGGSRSASLNTCWVLGLTSAFYHPASRDHEIASEKVEDAVVWSIRPDTIALADAPSTCWQDHCAAGVPRARRILRPSCVTCRGHKRALCTTGVTGGRRKGSSDVVACCEARPGLTQAAADEHAQRRAARNARFITGILLRGRSSRPRGRRSAMHDACHWRPSGRSPRLPSAQSPWWSWPSPGPVSFLSGRRGARPRRG